MNIKYPNVKVPLLGAEANAFTIMGNVSAAMKREGIERSEIDAYMKEATAGNFDHLLRVTMQWVDTDSDL